MAVGEVQLDAAVPLSISRYKNQINDFRLGHAGNVPGTPCIDYSAADPQLRANPITSSDPAAGGESADELLPHRLRERAEEGRPLRDRPRPRQRQLASASLFRPLPGKKRHHFIPLYGHLFGPIKSPFCFLGGAKLCVRSCERLVRRLPDMK